MVGIGKCKWLSAIYAPNSQALALKTGMKNICYKPVRSDLVRYIGRARTSVNYHHMNFPRSGRKLSCLTKWMFSNGGTAR